MTRSISNEVPDGVPDNAMVDEDGRMYLPVDAAEALDFLIGQEARPLDPDRFNLLTADQHRLSQALPHDPDAAEYHDKDARKWDELGKSEGGFERRAADGSRRLAAIDRMSALQMSEILITVATRYPEIFDTAVSESSADGIR